VHTPGERRNERDGHGRSRNTERGEIRLRGFRRNGDPRASTPCTEPAGSQSREQGGREQSEPRASHRADFSR
jgi:hypothetical protein